MPSTGLCGSGGLRGASRPPPACGGNAHPLRCIRSTRGRYKVAWRLPQVRPRLIFFGTAPIVCQKWLGRRECLMPACRRLIEHHDRRAAGACDVERFQEMDMSVPVDDGFRDLFRGRGTVSHKGPWCQCSAGGMPPGPPPRSYLARQDALSGPLFPSHGVSFLRWRSCGRTHASADRANVPVRARHTPFAAPR